MMFKSSLAALAACVVLSACGGAPSDDDFRSAMRAQMSAAGGKPAADLFKEELAKTKLIGCAKSDAGGYACDWNGPMGAGSARMVKGGEGWTLIPGRPQ
jgi:hypothetical protein